MKKLIILTFAFFSMALMAQQAEIDKQAPSFKLPDTNENFVNLSDYLGKWVVLEWVNYDCPFVRKHYNGSNMQTLQKEYVTKGVVWLSICSSAPGKQGNFTNDEIKSRMEKLKASPVAYLVDANGEVGKKYGAKHTPQIFIINPQGILAYAGAIDDIKSADEADVAKANNYVRMVLDAALSGKELPIKTSAPYGCSVKY
jgi:peroxiredoxin